MFSNLPGQKTANPIVLKGEVCEDHPDRPAVVRIQGETDSFGCEYIFFCEECEAAWDAAEAEPREDNCDWCKSITTTCQPFRDIGEGSHGPVYTVCEACRTRAYKDAVEELQYYSERDLDEAESDC
jgi:hypothetical protein